ncbi:hypothetical protein [Mesorhizobium sp.]|uniref:hypothetical protein n=1 Tax=Mesorhizobium sp. TaxID=1871066 RepID=UPI000FE838BD|nr:hypothetical protein [Mesorhizobium sp.]RWN35777.1 MAG: hypothetical protein EOR95_12305 [Mesorhizobium sp.]
MAAYYVRSGAAGAGTGADWANAYTTLAAALSGKAAGDVFYVSEDHAESQASTLTLTSPGTAANPCKILCVNHLGTVPPVSADLRTTATMTTTGNVSIIFAGSAYCRGLIFSAGNGAGTSNLHITSSDSMWVFEKSSLRIGSTGGGTVGMSTGITMMLRLIDTTVRFGNVAQGFSVFAGTIQWHNTANAIVAGGSIPTTMFKFTSSRSGSVELRGVDLSAVGVGKTIFDNAASNGPYACTMIDCKIDAAVTISGNPFAPSATFVDVWRVGASGVNYAQARYRYAGNLVQETTIVRTGGASDGTTPISWKITTTAGATWFEPFECPPIAIWNDTTGSAVTATIEGIWGGGAVPNDDEIWVEAEYLGDASSPMATFVNDSKANVLAAAAGQDAGSGTWGGSTTKFKLAVILTPQQKGWVLLRVKAAKVSSTFYVDPKVTLS